MFGRSPSRPLSSGPRWPSRRRPPVQRDPFRPDQGARLVAVPPDGPLELDLLPAAA